MSKKSTTITDIARLAGVSKKSVSRALNSEAGISLETRERIMGVIKETGYQPDRRARALAGHGSYLIALAYNNANPGYVLDLLNGALAEANRAGYELILHPVSAEAADAPLELQKLMRRSGADGLILTPPLSESYHMFEGFAEINKPLVRVSGDDVQSNIPQICFDDRAAAFAITMHLLELGHQNIAFLGGDKDSGPTRRRYAGFTDALSSQKLTLRDDWQLSGDFTFLSGIDAGKKILESDDRPTAVMCCNDEMAAGIIHAARNAGLRVPDNLSVTGFDDAPIAQQVWPPLTTVRQPLADMGAASISRLVEQIMGTSDKPAPLHFSHMLVERQSAGQLSR